MHRLIRFTRFFRYSALVLPFVLSVNSQPPNLKIHTLTKYNTQKSQVQALILSWLSPSVFLYSSLDFTFLCVNTGHFVLQYVLQ